MGFWENNGLRFDFSAPKLFWQMGYRLVWCRVQMLIWLQKVLYIPRIRKAYLGSSWKKRDRCHVASTDKILFSVSLHFRYFMFYNYLFFREIDLNLFITEKIEFRKRKWKNQVNSSFWTFSVKLNCIITFWKLFNA